jgi:Oxysterol-binding protein
VYICCPEESHNTTKPSEVRITRHRPSSIVTATVAVFFAFVFAFCFLFRFFWFFVFFFPFVQMSGKRNKKKKSKSKSNLHAPAHAPAHADAHVVVGVDAAQVQDLLKRVEALIERAPEPEQDEKGNIFEYGAPGWVRGKSGGLKCVNEAEMSVQKGVLGDLIRRAGAAIVNGDSIMNISLPVRIFEARSFLERITDTWCFAPIFLTRAAAATDPIERIKYCMTFLVSGLHRGCTNWKPFNPILGETLQASYPDGSQIFMEQISHHPPISQFQLFGPSNIYHMYGHHNVSASFGANSLRASQKGPNCIEFLDGTRVEFNMPHVLLSGTMFGERNFQWVGTVHFIDEKNDLHAELVFNPDSKGTIMSWFTGKAKTLADAVRGTIYRGPKPAKKADQADLKVVSTCSGSWIESLSFDDQVYWQHQDMKPLATQRVDSPLPSDCSYRDDLVHLKAGDSDSAEQWKKTLEQRQRDDRKLRAQYAKMQQRLQKLNN